MKKMERRKWDDGDLPTKKKKEKKKKKTRSYEKGKKMSQEKGQCDLVGF